MQIEKAVVLVGWCGSAVYLCESVIEAVRKSGGEVVMSQLCVCEKEIGRMKNGCML